MVVLSLWPYICLSVSQKRKNYRMFLIYGTKTGKSSILNLKKNSRTVLFTFCPDALTCIPKLLYLITERLGPCGIFKGFFLQSSSLISLFIRDYSWLVKKKIMSSAGTSSANAEFCCIFLCSFVSQSISS